MNPIRHIMRRLASLFALGAILIPGVVGIREASVGAPVEFDTLASIDTLDPVERKVVGFFEERGITDRVAIAVLLGNIRQESQFHSNICEGGARVPYNQGTTGGYGLIQWTTKSRYNGLGTHALVTGGDPSSLDTQLSYLVTEGRWLAIEHKFQKPGQSMDYYMDAAYYWLGWGVHGNRTTYSQQYLKQLS